MTAGDLLAGMAETWPPEGIVRVGPWVLRRALGAGNRATCASATGEVTGADLSPLADAARGLGQVPTVMLRPGEEALDALLEGAGWRTGEEVVLYAAPLDRLGAPPPAMTAFAVWPPLAVQRMVWAGDGTGPAKQRVMDRAPAPKAAILGRTGDRVAGAAFVAVAGGVVFLHALAVTPALRRQGTARNIVGAAAAWGQAQGADRMALAVTRGNGPARALYAGMGLVEAGRYHYRVAG